MRDVLGQANWEQAKAQKHQPKLSAWQTCQGLLAIGMGLGEWSSFSITRQS